MAFKIVSSGSHVTTSGTYKLELWMQAFALISNLCTIVSLRFTFWDIMRYMELHDDLYQYIYISIYM